MAAPSLPPSFAKKNGLAQRRHPSIAASLPICIVASTKGPTSHESVAQSGRRPTGHGRCGRVVAGRKQKETVPRKRGS